MPGSRPRCVIVGIGNTDRGDDSAGRAVARSLRGTLPMEVEILEHDGEATSLLSCLDGAERAYLVDACVSGTRAGNIRRFDVAAGPLPQDQFDLSTHGLGLFEALELARALGQLPARCIVYAIEGGSFEPGVPLSAPVAAAVEHVAARLRSELVTEAETAVDA